MNVIARQQELMLALSFRALLLKTNPIYLTGSTLRDMLDVELYKLLNAKNKELADSAYQKLQSALTIHLFQNESYLKTLTADLQRIIKLRSVYLPTHSKRFFSYWREQGWISTNLGLLMLPFILDFSVPSVEFALLIYAGIMSAAATFDFTRISKKYWLEEGADRSHELSHQDIKRLRTYDKDVDLFLAKDPCGSDHDRPSTVSYMTYALVFGLSLIGLAEIVFRPIGIPDAVLLLLSVAAIVGTGMQIGVLHRRYHYQRLEGQEERDLAKKTSRFKCDLKQDSILRGKSPHSQQKQPLRRSLDKEMSKKASFRPFRKRKKEKERESDPIS